MILQELVALYDRLASNGEADLPTQGWSREQVSFALVIDDRGALVAVEDLRDTRDGTPRPARMTVPAHPKRSIAVEPAFLCDNSSYLLGADGKGKPERALQCLRAARELHKQASELVPNSPELRAVSEFLDSWNPANAETLEYAKEITGGGNIVFRISGRHAFVHEDQAAVGAWKQLQREDSGDADAMVCLVTGKAAPPARLHPSIKGVKGGQATGTSIVSFNKEAFASYGKIQGLNSPVSELAAFKYVTALNRLLAGRENRLTIGDATTVFWAERSTQFENVFNLILGGGDSGAEEIRVALERMRAGKPLAEIDPGIRFFVLGLTPNQSRLSVRFWLRDTVGHLSADLSDHLRDCSVEKRYSSEPDVVSLWHLVTETGTRRYGEKGKKPVRDDPSPTLLSALTEAVLTGVDYPAALLGAMVRRIRADGEVHYFRITGIRAVINRGRRKSNKEELPMALDESLVSPGYQLGRLFAVLEKAQSDAVPGINATIKDRYYGAASSTPGRVFPILIRLTQHHVAKAEWGRATDRIMAGVMDAVSEFPATLNLEQQGLFALGYYHQRNALYRKREEGEGSNG